MTKVISTEVVKTESKPENLIAQRQGGAYPYWKIIPEVPPYSPVSHPLGSSATWREKDMLLESFLEPFPPGCPSRNLEGSGQVTASLGK